MISQSDLKNVFSPYSSNKGLQHLISMCQNLGKSCARYESELEGITQNSSSPDKDATKTITEKESISETDDFSDEDVNVLLS